MLTPALAAEDGVDLNFQTDDSELALKQCVNNYEVIKRLQKQISEKDAEITGLYLKYRALNRERERSEIVGDAAMAIDAEVIKIVQKIMDIVSVRSMKAKRSEEAESMLRLCQERVFEKKLVEKFCNLEDNLEKSWCLERF